MISYSNSFIVKTICKKRVQILVPCDFVEIFMLTSRQLAFLIFFAMCPFMNNYIELLLLLSHISRVRLCDPIDCCPPGSLVPGILQARTLEWVAISFSNA